MNIYLDNNPVLWPQDNLLKPSFTIRRKDENGIKAFSMTGDLTFIGDDYDYLYSRLKTDTNALINRVVIKFEYTCCGSINPKNIWEFHITSESIKWCDNECSITAAAIEKSVESDKIVCLKNTLISKNDPTLSFPTGFQNVQHPRFSYCNEIRPIWLHHLILVFGILIGITVQLLTPIAAVMSAVIQGINNAINTLNSLPGVSISLITFADDLTFLEAYTQWRDNILNRIIGCGRKHPSPLIRDYAKNVCEQCGLQFSSTIFDNPSSQYHNACYHNAPIHKGVPVTGTNAGVNSTDYWINDNQPLLTGFMFFDQLKGLFNGEWRVSNNTLIFERRDAFTNSTPWIDLTQLDEAEYECCYSWAKKQRYAYGRFTYQKDAVNTVGSEANSRWSDIVEWNQPNPTPLQKDEFVPNIQFTTCRFRNDGVDDDVLSAYTQAPIIGPLITGYDTSIIMDKHTCFTPMILIWDPATGVDDARVNPTQYVFSHPKASANQFYNYPMWFWDNGQAYASGQGNLYTNFWAIENPRSAGFLGIEYEATVELTCDRLNALDLDGMIKTKEGNGNISQIEIDFANNTMTIKGEI